MNHGTVLANIRRKAGCSQSRLVSIIGRMSVAGISDIECGRRPLHEITPRELDAIASALGLNEDDKDALWEAAAASFAARTEWGSALLRSRHARKGAPMADGLESASGGAGIAGSPASVLG
jgi:transcriptional regulator with XRE-family HTH domain